MNKIQLNGTNVPIGITHLIDYFWNCCE